LHNAPDIPSLLSCDLFPINHFHARSKRTTLTDQQPKPKSKEAKKPRTTQTMTATTDITVHVDQEPTLADDQRKTISTQSKDSSNTTTLKVFQSIPIPGGTPPN
jgi:hypothetical protein